MPRQNDDIIKRFISGGNHATVIIDNDCKAMAPSGHPASLRSTTSGCTAAAIVDAGTGAQLPDRRAPMRREGGGEGACDDDDAADGEDDPGYDPLQDILADEPNTEMPMFRPRARRRSRSQQVHRIEERGRFRAGR